ncbi:MAG: HNH endonuclease, partial [Flavobacteriales bacterium]
MNVCIRWKKISDLKDFEISTAGKIRNHKTKIPITPCQTKNGYLKTNIFYNGKRYSQLIHRIVLREFTYACSLQVNHKDGNKKNNHLENLEYVTQSENIKHAFRLGIQCHTGEKNPAHKLTEDDIKNIRNLAAEKKLTQRQLAKTFGISQSSI